MLFKAVFIFVIVIALFLRFYALGEIPFGLFGDEIDAGYNAYSIWMIGKDYNGNWLPVHSQSMGDWRAAGFFWILAPIVGILGLSDFTVRLVPAVWGVFNVLLFYLFIRLFVRRNNLIEKIKYFPEMVALMMLISPWHVHFSRIGLEQSVFLGFVLFGVYGWLKNGYYRWVGIVSLGLAAYVYHVGKLFVPLLFLGLVFIEIKTWKAIVSKKFGLWILTFIITLSPLVVDTIGGAGISRFGSINIWSDPKVVDEIVYHRSQIPSWPGFLSRVVENKGFYFASNFLSNYFSSWNPSFLFVEGDVRNPRHSMPGFGLFYWWMLPGFIAGLYSGWSLRKSKWVRFMWYWLLIGPIPSALTQGGGNHAIRLFVWLPSLLFFISLGFSKYVYWIKKYRKFWIMGLSVSIIFLSMGLYGQKYFYHYSQTSYHDWQYGLKPALKYVKSVEDNYDQIIVTRSFVHLPMLYYVFYYQFDPENLHQLFVNSEDNNALPPTEKIGKYRFMTLTKGDTYLPDRSLYVSTPWDKPDGWRVVKEIYSLDPANDKPLLLILDHI